MNKHHPNYLDRSLWDRAVNPNFANLRLSLGFQTIGSAKNPPRYIIPSEAETLRILKSWQDANMKPLKKFLNSEIKILEKLGLDTTSQEDYLKIHTIGVETK